MNTISKQRGFTLIELLVVISIIGMLASVVLASLSGARAKAAVGAGLTFSNHTYQALGSDALATYNFNDGTNNGPVGTAGVTDTSGNNFGPGSCFNNTIGTFVNDTPTGSGFAVKITGNGNYCQVQATGPKFSGSGYSFSVWFKPSSGDDVLPIAFQTSVMSDYAMVEINLTSNSIIFHTAVSASGDTITTSSSGVRSGAWNNIAGSFNFSTKVATLYLNGNMIGGPTMMSSAGSFSGNRLSYLYFQTMTSSSNALYDDIYLYNQSMTAYDARNIYAMGLKSHQLADAK